VVSPHFTGSTGMPYQIRNENEIWHFKGNRWSLKQKCKSKAAAESAIRLLHGVEHSPEFAKKDRMKSRRKGK